MPYKFAFDYKNTFKNQNLFPDHIVEAKILSFKLFLNKPGLKFRRKNHLMGNDKDSCFKRIF